MSGPGFPAIAQLVPHTGPMCLLDRVLEHAPGRTVCAVDPARSRALAPADDGVPAWVGLEYMAQCIAAHGGLVARARGEAARPGLLLGSRRLDFAVQRFAVDRWLRVAARHHRGESGLVCFDCEVAELDGGELLVHGRINVFVADRWEALEAIGGDAV